MDNVHAKRYGFDGFALNDVPKDNLKGATPQICKQGNNECNL